MIEVDRLAEYASGLLDGTPEGVEVGRLVATDPAWARAYADLTAADRLVLADLRSLGVADEPMPADVAARLDAALTGTGNVVSLADARRRRKRRVAAIAAVAAGVVAFGVVGLNALPDRRGPADLLRDNDHAGDTTAGKGAPPAAAPEVAAAPQPQNAGVVVYATGMDYRRDTPLGALGGGRGRADKKFNGPGPAVYTLDPVPEELVPLVDPFARQACLAAVTRTYGGRAESVDYARFEGAPALVIRLSGPDRTVIAGPACGLRGGTSDERYATPTR